METLSKKASRILHVVDAFLMRTEIFIYHYLTAFQEIEPHVLARSLQNEEAFPLKDVHVINAPEKRLSLSWFRSALYRVFAGKSLRQCHIEALVKDLKPALIHAHFGPNGWDMLPIKKKFNIPLITTFYGYDMSRLPKEKIWKKRYAELFAQGDLFLVEGPYMSEKLIELGAPKEKVKIQRIAIRFDRYPEWKPADGRPTVLFIGRFAEKKGLIYALQALPEVKMNIPNLQFRIIGDGPEKSSLEQFVRDHQMKDYVHFLGIKPHDEMILEMSKAHVLVQPSVTAKNGDSEGGAPTTLLEAQAIGIPIVTTRHADIPNVVSQKSSGIFLCDERNSKALASALKIAMTQKEKSDRTYVEEYHNVIREVKRLETIYRQILGEKRCGAAS